MKNKNNTIKTLIRARWNFFFGAALVLMLGGCASNGGYSGGYSEHDPYRAAHLSSALSQMGAVLAPAQPQTQQIQNTRCINQFGIITCQSY